MSEIVREHNDLKLLQCCYLRISSLWCKYALVCGANWPELVCAGVGDCNERRLILAYVLPDLACILVQCKGNSVTLRQVFKRCHVTEAVGCMVQ